MNEKVNIFNKGWCDLIFIDRNKEYGAYVLRRLSFKRQRLALLITVTFCVLAITLPAILKTVNPDKEEKMVEVTVLSDLKMEVKKEAKPKDIFVEEPEVKIKKTMKFVAPIITKDEEVKDEEIMKTQEQVTQSKVTISTVDVENGSEDDDAVTMADLNARVVEDTLSEPYLVVEQMPQFPGGDGALLKYLAKNMTYPVVAQENGIQGRVYIRFIINISGNVSHVEVVRGIDKSCDDEAVRVIRSMPKWIPGRQNGNAVRVSYSVPVTFKLN